MVRRVRFQEKSSTRTSTLATAVLILLSRCSLTLVRTTRKLLSIWVRAPPLSSVLASLRLTSRRAKTKPTTGASSAPSFAASVSAMATTTPRTGSYLATSTPSLTVGQTLSVLSVLSPSAKTKRLRQVLSRSMSVSAADSMALSRRT